MKREKYGKRFLKYCPFGLYDAECLQIWLEKCAESGIFLTGSGSIFPGVLMMEYGEPEICRYRILSVLPRTQDDREMYRMMEESGWKFVAEGSAGMEIYYTDNPDAPEIHSDPDLQAEETGRVKKYNFALDFPLFILMMAVWRFGLRSKTGISAADVVWLCLMALFWILSLAVRWRSFSIQEKRLKDRIEIDEKYYRNMLLWRQIYRFCILGCLGTMIVFAAIKIL